MTLRFLGFLSRSTNAAPELSIESQERSGPRALSQALGWVQRFAPTAPAAPRGRLRPSTRLLLMCALAHIAALQAPHLIGPILDRALRPEVYSPASAAIDAARAAGFEGEGVALGSWSAREIWEDYLHASSPERHPEKGLGANASFPRLRAGPVSLIPERCNIRLGSNPGAALFANREMDLRFTALHELSHCDTRMGQPVGYAPSAQEMSPDEAKALRLIILAESRVLEKEQGRSSPLLQALREPFADDEDQRSRLSGLASSLFSESVADARALLILSRLEPQTWRESGWALWLERSAGEMGSSSSLLHSHATEGAIDLILSISDQDLARLDPGGLTQLAGFAGSDALAERLARQRWHELFDPERLPGAIDLALRPDTLLSARHPAWREGHLLAMGASPSALQKDLAWMGSSGGQRALGRLFERMRVAQAEAAKPALIEREIDGLPIRYSRSPSAGSFDARYEGAATRSMSAWALSAAALLNRAARHAPEERLAQGPQWEAIRLGNLRQHPLLLSLEAQPPSHPVYFGRRRGLEAPYFMGASLEEARLQEAPRPEPSKAPARRGSPRP